MTDHSDTYALAVLIHGQAIDVGLVARVCCDNAPNPRWWCEVTRGGPWQRAS